jgi:hypothetical protein
MSVSAFGLHKINRKPVGACNPTGIPINSNLDLAVRSIPGTTLTLRALGKMLDLRWVGHGCMISIRKVEGVDGSNGTCRTSGQ